MKRIKNQSKRYVQNFKPDIQEGIANGYSFSFATHLQNLIKNFDLVMSQKKCVACQILTKMKSSIALMIADAEFN